MNSLLNNNVETASCQFIIQWLHFTGLFLPFLAPPPLFFIYFLFLWVIDKSLSKWFSPFLICYLSLTTWHSLTILLVLNDTSFKRKITLYLLSQREDWVLKGNGNSGDYNLLPRWGIGVCMIPHPVHKYVLKDLYSRRWFSNVFDRVYEKDRIFLI